RCDTHGVSSFFEFLFVDGAAARMDEIAPSLSTWDSCPLFPRLSAKPEFKMLASGFVIALRAMGDAIKGGNNDGQGTVRPRDDEGPRGARGRICRSRGREHRCFQPPISGTADHLLLGCGVGR